VSKFVRNFLSNLQFKDALFSQKPNLKHEEFIICNFFTVLQYTGMFFLLFATFIHLLTHSSIDPYVYLCFYLTLVFFKSFIGFLVFFVGWRTSSITCCQIHYGKVISSRYLLLISFQTNVVTSFI